jgi:hypothetical protein
MINIYDFHLNHFKIWRIINDIHGEFFNMLCERVVRSASVQEILSTMDLMDLYLKYVSIKANKLSTTTGKKI